MSFFIRKGGKATGGSRDRLKGKGAKKRPTPTATAESVRRFKKSKLAGSDDEEIESDSDFESDEEKQVKKDDDLSSSDDETAQEKRLRLAKKYLAQLEEEESEKAESEVVREGISDRLKHDILEQAGKLHKSVASEYQQPSVDDITICRGHKLSLTCVVVTSDDKHIFTGSKDCTIIKWSVATGKKVKVIRRVQKQNDTNKITGHSSHILCLAITTDNNLLASGDQNNLILLWQPDSCDLLHAFRGHRGAVTGLAFRRGSHQLFSASVDRSVKIWNGDEMAYVETLFGHQSPLTGIDSLSRERAVSSGGSDGSIRIWKIIEESQLVFHGHSGSIDCVSLIDEEHFVSGANDNSLAIWSVMKKKPIAYKHKAHTEEGTRPADYWITSVASLIHTDLVASGSRDGQIRLWKCSNEFKTMSPLMSIQMPGFINGLKFSNDGSFLVAAVGQEHRLGRWWSLKESKNSVCIIRLPKLSDK